MKNVLRAKGLSAVFCSAVVLCVAILGGGNAAAVPTITFSEPTDGNVNGLNYDYDDIAGKGTLNVQAVVTDFIDIEFSEIGLPPVVPSDCSLAFQVDWISAESDDSFAPGSTTGFFGTSVLDPDFTITAGDGDDTTLLLAGDILSLTMQGVNGSTSGIINGFLSTKSGTEGGLLSSFFNSGADIIAFQFNMDSAGFDPDMFQSSFEARIRGDLYASPVPEPGTLFLMTLGMLGIAGIGRHRRQDSRDNRPATTGLS